MLAYLFVVFAVAVRFLPHPWMFTPVTGSLLFFGARGQRRQLWIPFALLVASDIVLTTMVYKYRLEWDQLVVFAWYAAVLWLGTRLDKNAKPLPIVGAALASSISFYVVTNFAAWITSDMYAKNLGGLMMSYTLAIPFFRHAVEGDLLFTAAMFATPVALKWIEQHFAGEHGSSATA
ncbi:MAG TPA: DUF6580 family putative transport protein [Terriglobales bacterium]